MADAKAVDVPLGEQAEARWRWAEGSVDEDGKRVSKQPGRCCPVGCQVPETPQLDYTPAYTPKLEKLDPAAE